MQSLVAIIQNSQADWEIMQHVGLTLGVLGIPFEVKILSAQRTPDALAEYARTAENRGLQVIIAGNSGSAHLPGMIASYTLLPVFGVPLPNSELNGIDSLLSIVQMPAGTPVGTLGIGRNGAINAALLAAQILARHDTRILDALNEYRIAQAQKILDYPLPDL